MIVTTQDAERISKRITIHPDTGCWLFPSHHKDGYSRIKIAGKTSLVHRAVFTYCRGPIPHGLTLDHVKAWGCTFHSCCNPSHLEPVTHQINISRGFFATKEHCKRGHPFTTENTLILSTGSRACRACARIRLQVFQADNPEYVKTYDQQYRAQHRDVINARSKAWRAAQKHAERASL